MIKLDKALDNLKFDIRMVDWNIKNGIISKSDLEKHLNALNDLATSSETLEIEVEPTQQEASSEESFQDQGNGQMPTHQ